MTKTNETWRVFGFYANGSFWFVGNADTKQEAEALARKTSEHMGGGDYRIEVPASRRTSIWSAQMFKLSDLDQFQNSREAFDQI